MTLGVIGIKSTEERKFSTRISKIIQKNKTMLGKSMDFEGKSFVNVSLEL